MLPDTPAQITKALAEVDNKTLSLVYKDMAQPGVKQVGKAMETVFSLGNTILLPLKLLNEKAQLLFASHMEAYRKRLENVPEEKIVEVAPEIGVPIVEKLEKTVNPKLSELYINLLAASSVTDTVALTHPRFVLLIESMAPDEVKILEHLWRPRKHLPFIRVTATEYYEGGGTPPLGRPIETVLNNATILETGDYLNFPKNTPLYLNNLVALGLVHAEDTRMTVDKTDYGLLEKHFQEIVKYNASLFAINNKLPQAFITIHHGYYDLTDLGLSFLKVCSPKEEQPATPAT